MEDEWGRVLREAWRQHAGGYNLKEKETADVVRVVVVVEHVTRVLALKLNLPPARPPQRSLKPWAF